MALLFSWGQETGLYFQKFKTQDLYDIFHISIKSNREISSLTNLCFCLVIKSQETKLNTQNVLFQYSKQLRIFFIQLVGNM
jgi:hypothetical protein